MRRSSRGARLRRAGLAGVCALAALQVGLGLLGLCLAAALGIEWKPEVPGSTLPDWQRATNALAFGALSAYLLLGARRDERVANLGAFFLVLATFFALPPIHALEKVAPGAARTLLAWIQALPVHALTPALGWLFFRDFPRALDGQRTARFVRGAIVASLAAAALLIAANLVIGLRGEAGELARFDRRNQVSHYWTVVFGLLAPTIPFALWRTRHAPIDERRRVGFFVTGLALVAVLPVFYAILPALWTPVQRFFERGDVEAVMRPLNLAMNLSLAGITAYAVLVQHVLDVRTVLRKAAQYGLARLVVGALAGAPFVLLAVLVYRGRNEPLALLFEGTRLVLWLGGLGAGLAVLRLRHPAMAAIDRLFFREAYDARQILAEVAERSRSAESSTELARSLTTEIDRALHLESVGLLVKTIGDDAFVPVADGARTIDSGSELVQRLAKNGKPMSVDLERGGGALEALPEEDLVWIADSGAQVLVPLVGSRNEITGLLALGPKRSELPFSREDMLLLATLGASAGIGLENLRLRESPGGRALPAGGEQPASECQRCGEVAGPDPTGCPACGGPVQRCPLPQELFGKFRLDRRIGSGGMGVVYRATDLALGRAVALKTLPATSPSDAARLRREARAMASITHPNLALIFGAETWQGTPILVIEYLAGRTLTERLESGPMDPHEALALAMRIAEALEHAHRSGILHRDVKPSNIGYTEAGVPKLLDFGLVRIAGGADGQGVAPVAPVGFDDALTESGLLGTPLYMSPEALAGRVPDAGFDLWSLGVVAFEAIAGRHPFERETAGATLDAIQRGRALPLAEAKPTCPPQVALLFARLLAPDRSDRPGSARELARDLRRTADSLGSLHQTAG